MIFSNVLYMCLYMFLNMFYICIYIYIYICLYICFYIKAYKIYIYIYKNTETLAKEKLKKQRKKDIKLKTTKETNMILPIFQTRLDRTGCKHYLTWADFNRHGQQLIWNIYRTVRPNTLFSGHHQFVCPNKKHNIESWT